MIAGHSSSGALYLALSWILGPLHAVEPTVEVNSPRPGYATSVYIWSALTGRPFGSHELLRRPKMVQLRHPAAAARARSATAAGTARRRARELPRPAWVRGHRADVRLPLGLGPQSAREVKEVVAAASTGLLGARPGR